MCGIHGFISGTKRNANADDFVKQAFVAGSLRGTDASGIFSVKDGMDPLYQKLPVSGPMFITDGYAQGLMKAAAELHTITVCHTRSTTTGSKGGISESHPFYVTDGTRELIGVHNGTLSNWYTLNKGRFKVDSEFAMNHIFEKGLDAFKDFTGSYCFVWWDSDDQDTLNIALNNDRPMHIAFSADDGMAFASEPGMLAWLMERNRIKRTSKILECTGGNWYQFNTKDLANYTRVSLPAYVPAPYVAPATPVTTTASRTVTYETTVEKVDAFLARISAAADTTVNDITGGAVPVVQSTTSKPYLRQGEVKKAQELHIMGKKALFEPLQLTEGSIYGIVFLKDTELTGIIRNAGHIIWQKGDSWDVSVIGAYDDGSEITAVCGHPDSKETRGTKRAKVSVKQVKNVSPTSSLGQALLAAFPPIPDITEGYDESIIEGQCTVIDPNTLTINGQPIEA